MTFLDDLKALNPVDCVPFAAIMLRSGTTPVLMDFLVPGMDLVIWQLRPCVRQSVDAELRHCVLRVLDHAVDNVECGASVVDIDGFTFFAFRSAHRAQILAEMRISEVVP